MRTKTFLFWLLWILGVLPGMAAEELTIAGTGASQRLLRDVAQLFDAGHPGCVTRIPDSVGSRGGIRALLAGKVDLARTSRALREREAASGLSYLQFAQTEVVFVVHPSVQAPASLSVSQLADIYAGRITNWREVGGPDHRIFPLTRDGGTTLKTVVRHLPQLSDSRAHAKSTFSSLETLKLLQQHEFTIGFVPHTLTVGTPLKVIAIDGLTGAGSAVSGAAPRMGLALGLVYHGEPAGCAASFMEFLGSNEAGQAIRGNNSEPVGREPE